MTLEYHLTILASKIYTTAQIVGVEEIEGVGNVKEFYKEVVEKCRTESEEEMNYLIDKLAIAVNNLNL